MDSLKVLTCGHRDNHVMYEVVRVYKGQPYIMLTYLYVRPIDRRKGYAKDLLRQAQSIATSMNLPLVLFVAPYADKPMAKDQLYRFYRSMGFERTHGTYMKWVPQVEQMKEAA